jgi:hypothetical protein
MAHICKSWSLRKLCPRGKLQESRQQVEGLVHLMVGAGSNPALGTNPTDGPIGTCLVGPLVRWPLVVACPYRKVHPAWTVAGNREVSGLVHSAACGFETVRRSFWHGTS